jgi:two-component system response regulator BaeR
MNKFAYEILIVEDEHKIAMVLNGFLSQNGFACTHVTDGRAATNMVRARSFDALVLDITLPGMSGFDVCRDIREFSTIPIILLTARTEEIDRVLGLELGADDYVCKPFSPREVGARLRSVLRRTKDRWAVKPDSKGFNIDEDARRINWKGKPLPLTPAEYHVLRVMLLHPSRVFDRDALLNTFSGGLRDSHIRAIDCHIKNLRRKLVEASIHGVAIQSVYGSGYRFEMAESEREK